MKTEIKNAGIALMALVLSVSVVSALGISLEYTKSNPLQLYPGQSVVVPLNLQNYLGNEDVMVELSIVEGMDIARFSQTEYLLKAGTYDNYANLIVTAPTNALIGAEEIVTVSLTTVNEENSKEMVSLGSAMEFSFPVQIVAKTEQPAPAISNNWILAIGVIVVLLILWWIVSSMSKGKKKRK